MKDRVVEKAALAYINSQLLTPYGTATSLRIDSTNRRIELELQLKGESLPVQVQINDYEIGQTGDRYFAKVREVRTSREWMTALAREQVAGRSFDLPRPIAELLTRTL